MAGRFQPGVSPARLPERPPRAPGRLLGVSSVFSDSPAPAAGHPSAGACAVRAPPPAASEAGAGPPAALGLTGPPAALSLTGLPATLSRAT